MTRTSPGSTALPTPETIGTLHSTLIDWYHRNARTLPWRRHDRTPWEVMVSEFMLQQTPVARVLPVWEQWMHRWPTPQALAAEPRGEAVRAWGRLGYPRRALRLHAAATAITAEHAGQVPVDEADLLALPGVGVYTAAAVAAFAHGRRAVVLDTNVRRVFTRVLAGRALPGSTVTAAETRVAAALLPASDADTAVWNVAVMEFGALVCTARSPRCDDCPLADRCAWLSAGRPAPDAQPRGQAWAGTTRQLRGAILAVLREAHGPVDLTALVATATGATIALDDAEPAAGDAHQRALTTLRGLEHGADRVRAALDGLAADGLVQFDGAAGRAGDGIGAVGRHGSDADGGGDGVTIRLPD